MAPLPELQLLLQTHPAFPVRSARPLPSPQLGLRLSLQPVPALRSRARAAIPQGGGLPTGQATTRQEPAEPQTHAAGRGVPELLLELFGGDIARGDQSAAAQERQEAAAGLAPQTMI